MACRATFRTAVEVAAGGESIGAEVSILKIIGADIQQRIVDLMLEAAGAIGIETDWIEMGGRRMQISQLYRQARRATIYGGSNQIQRNIVSRRVLDLPSWR